MSDAELRDHQRIRMEFVRISADERKSARVLRQRFSDFWGTASGKPRAIYDAFISASPLTHDVVLGAVYESDVRG
jgi:epsilon-lactone hydrolase